MTGRCQHVSSSICLQTCTFLARINNIAAHVRNADVHISANFEIAVQKKAPVHFSTTAIETHVEVAAIGFVHLLAVGHVVATAIVSDASSLAVDSSVASPRDVDLAASSVVVFDVSPWAADNAASSLAVETAVPASVVVLGVADPAAVPSSAVGSAASSSADGLAAIGFVHCPDVGHVAVVGHDVATAIVSAASSLAVDSSVASLLVVGLAASSVAVLVASPWVADNAASSLAAVLASVVVLGVADPAAAPSSAAGSAAIGFVHCPDVGHVAIVAMCSFHFLAKSHVAVAAIGLGDCLLDGNSKTGRLCCASRVCLTTEASSRKSHLNFYDNHTLLLLRWRAKPCPLYDGRKKMSPTPPSAADCLRWRRPQEGGSLMK